MHLFDSIVVRFIILSLMQFDAYFLWLKYQ